MRGLKVIYKQVNMRSGSKDCEWVWYLPEHHRFHEYWNGPFKTKKECENNYLQSLNKGE